MIKNIPAYFLLFILFFSSTAYAQPLSIGSAIPKAGVKMKAVSGRLIALQDAVEPNGLLVMFSSNACPYVIKNQARTSEICRYSLYKKIGVVLLNANEGARSGEDAYIEMKLFAGKQNYTWHYVLDSDHELADAFGATRTPECFLFDANGRLVYHGAIDDNPGEENEVTRNHLKLAINEMLGGKEISVKESRPVGCSIKRK